MAVPNRNMRGLQDIRTHSGRVDQTFQPYKAYLKIGALEMEKARRNKERESALHRVKIIEERFQAIEAEKTSLLCDIEQQNSNAHPADPKKGAPIRESYPKKSGFRIKY